MLIDYAKAAWLLSLKGSGGLFIGRLQAWSAPALSDESGCGGLRGRQHFEVAAFYLHCVR